MYIINSYLAVSLQINCTSVGASRSSYRRGKLIDYKQSITQTKFYPQSNTQLFITIIICIAWNIPVFKNQLNKEGTDNFTFFGG